MALKVRCLASVGLGSAIWEVVCCVRALGVVVLLFLFESSRRSVSDIPVDGTQTLSAKAAAALDKELMSTGAFSIDQLMELAGLSVSQVGQCDFSPGILPLEVGMLVDKTVQSTEFIPMKRAGGFWLLLGPATTVSGLPSIPSCC